jgi:hypothetical protein
MIAELVGVTSYSSFRQSCQRQLTIAISNWEISNGRRDDSGQRLAKEEQAAIESAI